MLIGQAIFIVMVQLVNVVLSDAVIVVVAEVAVRMSAAVVGLGGVLILVGHIVVGEGIGVVHVGGTLVKKEETRCQTGGRGEGGNAHLDLRTQKGYKSRRRPNNTKAASHSKSVRKGQILSTTAGALRLCHPIWWTAVQIDTFKPQDLSA